MSSYVKRKEFRENAKKKMKKTINFHHLPLRSGLSKIEGGNMIILFVSCIEEALNVTIKVISSKNMHSSFLYFILKSIHKCLGKVRCKIDIAVCRIRTLGFEFPSET